MGSTLDTYVLKVFPPGSATCFSPTFPFYTTMVSPKLPSGKNKSSNTIAIIQFPIFFHQSNKDDARLPFRFLKHQGKKKKIVRKKENKTSTSKFRGENQEARYRLNLENMCVFM